MPDMERSSSGAVGTAATTGTPARLHGDPLTVEAAPSQARESGHAAALPGTAHAWAALGGDSALLERISCTQRPVLQARLPVRELARAAVAVCSLAAAELSSLRAEGSAAGAEAGAGGRVGAPGVPSVHVDDGAVAAAFTGERHLRTDGRKPVSFAPLSRFWRTRDGWLRTHANYPHHRDRLLSALGVPADGEDEVLAEAVAAELAGRDSIEVEETVQAEGGLAVAVRTPEEWRAHPQGAQAARRPLLTIARLDQALPSSLPEPEGHGPLRGVRVLDLTRVLAGPVATRTLALFGADVLRIDSPHLPEDADTHAATGAGKRSTFLDLSARSGQAAFEELLSQADVVVTGYRPGSLDRFGLAPESLADRRPGVVVGQISAWGAYGPWHRRRGFDSLVQAACGIAHTQRQPDGPAPGQPGALPAQALDHSTGYLLAAAVMRALTEQRQGRCGARLVRTALVQTADWLLGGLAAESSAAESETAGTPATPQPDGSAGSDGDDPAAWLTETDSPLGRLRYALPPVGYEGAPSDWSRPPGTPGADPASWW